MVTPEEIILNTKSKCEETEDGKHRVQTNDKSPTGFVCRNCEKPIQRLCQVCHIPRLECENWNAYYESCEACI